MMFSLFSVCRRWQQLAGQILKRETDFDQVKANLDWTMNTSKQYN